MNQGNKFRGCGVLVHDQFEGVVYKIEDNVGKRPIRGHDIKLRITLASGLFEGAS